MAYGARLESVLGASPRGFESPILRHRTPGLLQVPGFLLFGTPLVFRAAGPAAVCAGGRRPARSPSALRASLGASARSPARPRCGPPAPRQVPPAPPHRRCLLDVWFDASSRGLAWPRCGPTVLPQVLGGAGQACGDVPCLVAAARVGRKRVCWGPVLRVTVSSEPPQGRNAARIRVRCRVRGGSLYMLLDHGRLQDAFLRCGSGHSS